VLQKTTLILIRHGESPANAAGVLQGLADEGLSPLGQAQAEALARHLPTVYPEATALYSSPLGRALQTAQAIQRYYPHLNIQIVPELAEFDTGQWDNLPYQQLREQHQLWQRMQADPDWAPPGGESSRAFVKRILRGLEQVASSHPGKIVLVVSHGGVISTALSILLEGHGGAWKTYMLPNCGYHELRWGSPPELARGNVTGHLTDVGVSTWPPRQEP